MRKPNKYGLGRNIPAEVKREVRKRCNFGCVICGAIIIDYEHFRPDFKDAREHDPDGITLLCPTHHGRVSRGVLSKKSIQEADEKARDKPSSPRESFSWGQQIPDLRIGGMISRSMVPLTFFDVPLLEFKEADEPNGPLLLNMTLNDSKGRPSLSIVENEWMPISRNWDVTMTGNLLKIWEERRKTCLQIRIQEGNILHIERLHMLIGDATIDLSAKGLKISTPKGILADLPPNQTILLEEGAQIRILPRNG